MKNILIILLLIISSQAFSQGRVGYRSVKVTDSVFAPTGRISAHEFYKDGVPFSAGGGDVYLGNRNIYTDKNTFNDTLRVTAIAIFDSVKVSGDVTASWFRGSGEHLTNIVADNIALGDLTDAVLSDNVMKFSSFDTAYVAMLNQRNVFTKSILFSDSIRATQMARFDSAIVSGNITVGSINNISVNEFPTVSDNNTFTGTNIFSDATNEFTGDGSNLNALNASAITIGTLDTARLSNNTPKDSSQYARTGSGISETISGIWTFVSDLIVGWVKNQSSVSAYQYEKVKIVASTMPSAVSTNKTFAHGITDWHTIKSWTVAVHEDSLNYILGSQSWFGVDILFYARLDSLNCSVTTGSSATSVKSDSVFFRIVYTDFSR